MKKNNSKRLLALMLSAIMVITLLPTTAFAAEEYALETNSYDMYASNTDAYVPNADGYDAYTPDGGTYYPQEIEEIATKDLNFSACATEICEGCGQCVPCDGHASFRWEKFNAYGYFISSPQRIIQYGNEYVRPPNPSLYVGGTIRAWARIYTYGPIPVNNPQLGQYGYAYRGPALSSSVNPFLVEIISAEMFDANENLINRCPEELGWVIRDHNSIRVSFGRQISEIPVGYRFNHGIPGFPWTTMEVYVMTACGEIESLRLTNNFYPCDCDFYYCCEYCQWIVCDFCIYCGECKNCSECLKFNWDIFNNGPLGAESRPNAGLEAINTIRLWTQIDGVNTRIPYPMNITAVIQGTDTCAMEFVRISRVWQDGTGWLNYVNLIDVRKYNEWEFIELTIIPFGCHDPVPVLLHNGNFTPQQYHTVTFVVQPGAPGAYVAQTTTVIVLDGQTIPVEAIPTYGPARTGFYFAGWYLGVSPDWVAQHPDSYGNVYGDRIFTARFNNLNHQVIFEAGSGGELEFIAPWFNPITIRDGMLFWAERVPTPVPNSGYRFLRWEFDGVEVNPAGFQVVNPHPRTLNDYLREEMTLTFTAVFEQITFTLTPDEVTICNGSTFCSPACVLDNRHVPVYIGGNATGAITFTNPDPELITIIENQGLWTPAGPAHGIVVGVRGGVTLTEPRTFEVEVTREGVMQVVTIHLVPCVPPSPTLILNPTRILVDNDNLEVNVGVEGTATGEIVIIYNEPLPYGMEVRVDQNVGVVTVEFTGQRPACDETAISERFTVVVQREGQTRWFVVDVLIEPYPCECPIEPTGYTVTYNANSVIFVGEVPVNPNRFEAGDIVQVSSTRLIKDGYLHVGWGIDDATGDADFVSLGGNFTISGDVTLYAIWVWTWD